ncbi:hypothetical protein, partial [Micromonospora profundi]|uniref:hypothetical protein n=1 Tax=Micromonospora profundi TaxID=1420889 RepID=UPI003662FBCF
MNLGAALTFLWAEANRVWGNVLFTTADEFLRYLKNEDVKFVDVRFCDLPGVMQHFNLPVES